MTVAHLCTMACGCVYERDAAGRWSIKSPCAPHRRLFKRRRP